jgi:branched-chain amino acid aminotransferase
MRSYGGRVFALGEHLRRLRESAAGLGIALPEPSARIGAWVAACVRSARRSDAFVRLVAARLRTGSGVALVLFVRRIAPRAPALYARGVSVRTAATRRGPPRAWEGRVKSNQYAAAVAGLFEGAGSAAGDFEVLFLNAGGFLAEGTISNVAVVKDGAVFTPGAWCGILLGITRQLVAEAADRIGVPFRETVLTRHDLYGADEVFLTTSVAEVVPVVRCDGRAVGGGKPGPVTRRLHAAYRRLVAERCRKGSA